MFLAVVDERRAAGAPKAPQAPPPRVEAPTSPQRVTTQAASFAAGLAAATSRR